MNKLFTKFSAVALFAMLSGNAMATDYYLSANGVDTNDGTSAEKAVATLNKGVSLLKSGEDILHVSGFIKVNTVVRVAKNFTVNIEGSSAAKDGFDGEGKSAILSFESTSGVKLANLAFENGYSAFDGDANHRAYAAMYSYKTNLSLDGCVFENNKTGLVDAVTPNSNAVGGAIFALGGGSKLDIKNSQFLTNTSAANGGAISAFDVDVTISNTLFKGNVAAVGGGALNFSNANSYSIKNSSFIQNVVLQFTDQGDGGAIKVYSDKVGDEYNIENSTFYGNKADRYGSVYQITTKTAERTVNFTNCTIVGNISNNANGAALSIYNNTAKVMVANSILEGNVANNAYIDILNQNNKSKATVTITNSLIGNISGYDETVFPATDSKLNNVKTLSTIKYAGFGDLNADNQLPLIANCVAATVKGTDGKLIGAVATATDTPADGTYCAATLKDDGSAATVTACRHLKGGQWNTLALPFQINKGHNTSDYVDLFGANAKIGTLNKVENGVLSFEDRSDAKTKDVPSQRPFIVKPVNDVVVNVTRATEVANGPTQTRTDSNNKSYSFISVMNPTDLNSMINDNTQVVCLGKDGNFFKLEKDSQKTTIKGLRCYFTFPATESAARFSIGFNDGGTTGINGVNAEGAVKNAKIYTLGGQYMGTNANNLPQGVYVIGSKKVVVK